jgi:hypothetical protein
MSKTARRRAVPSTFPIVGVPMEEQGHDRGRRRKIERMSLDNICPTCSKRNICTGKQVSISMYV